jgi:hypothetical protein
VVDAQSGFADQLVLIVCFHILQEMDAERKFIQITHIYHGSMKLLNCYTLSLTDQEVVCFAKEKKSPRKPIGTLETGLERHTVILGAMRAK